jgi:superfamily II helicase
MQTKSGLQERVAAYHADLSIQQRRDVHGAFMHDRILVCQGTDAL